MKESFNSDQHRQASGAWLKYKVKKSREFVIGGYTPGNPLDAVVVGYYDGDKLIYAAKVRNGFVPRLRREVWQKLKGLEIASCPFANLPEKHTQFSLTREEMKNCIWLKPQLVAQIEFTEWTADKHLRHAKFWDCEMIKIPIKRRGSSGASRLLIKGATLYLATYSVAHGCGNNTPRVAARGGL